MSRAGFAYAQARLHARLAERLDDSDWQYLEGSRNLAHCLEVIGRTSAAGIVAQLDKNSNPHEIEHMLRAAWFSHIAEVTEWLPDAWQSPVTLMALLPHLRSAEFIASGQDTPDWLRLDPMFEQVFGQDTAADVSTIWLQELARRIPDKAAHKAITFAMDQIFRRYLVYTPVGVKGEKPKGLNALTELLERQFRTNTQSPVAVFNYIGLAALDFERLRGILSLRAVFPDLQRDTG